MQQLAKSLGITSLKDWWLVSYNDVLRHGGRGLLKYYNGSLQRALHDNYQGYAMPSSFMSKHQVRRHEKKVQILY
jgi:hypothetical protein